MLFIEVILYSLTINCLDVGVSFRNQLLVSQEEYVVGLFVNLVGSLVNS